MILAKDVPVAVADVPMAFNQDMKAVLFKSEVEPLFVLYSMISQKEELNRVIGSTAHGTRRVGTESLAAWELPCPPVSEQLAIAQALSAVQEARNTRQRELTLERERKAALMQHLFTHGSRGESTKQTEMGKIPASWNIIPLGELLRERLRNGHSANATNTGEGVRTLTLTAVTKNDFSINNTKLTCADPEMVAHLWLQPGDILVERANTPEYVGLASLYRGSKGFAIYPDLMTRVRVDESRVSSPFLTQFLLTDCFAGTSVTKRTKLPATFPRSTIIPLHSCRWRFRPYLSSRFCGVWGYSGYERTQDRGNGHGEQAQASSCYRQGNRAGAGTLVGRGRPALGGAALGDADRREAGPDSPAPDEDEMGIGVAERPADARHRVTDPAA